MISIQYLGHHSAIPEDRYTALKTIAVFCVAGKEIDRSNNVCTSGEKYIQLLREFSYRSLRSATKQYAWVVVLG